MATLHWKPSCDSNLSHRHQAWITSGALGPVHRPDLRHIHQADSIHKPHAPNQPSQRSPRHPSSGTKLPALPGASPPMQPRWQASPRAAPSATRGGPVDLFQSPPPLPGRCWSGPVTRARANGSPRDNLEVAAIRTQLQQRQVEAEQLRLRLAQLEQGGRGGDVSKGKGKGKGQGKGRGRGGGRGRGRGDAGPQVPQAPAPAAAAAAEEEEAETTPRAPKKPEQWPLTGRRSGAGATLTPQERAAWEELEKAQAVKTAAAAPAEEADAAAAAAAAAAALAASHWALTGGPPPFTPPASPPAPGAPG